MDNISEPQLMAFLKHIGQHAIGRRPVVVKDYKPPKDILKHRKWRKKKQVVRIVAQTKQIELTRRPMMSTPITPTPNLKGKEAEKFLKQVDDKDIQPAPKEEVLRGKAAYEALMPECPYRDDCASHLLSPRELYKLLSLSEIRIQCPHCGFITFWDGKKEPPIQCKECDNYFLAKSPEVHDVNLTRR